MEKRLHFSLFDNAVFIKSVIIICFFSFFSAKAFSQATVQTDKPDYPPGSTVYITGSGFAANEPVTLQVLHVGGDDDDDLTSTAHQPWTVTADANGNISTTWYVPADQDELDATLQLTATGQTSGIIAQVTFTDAQPKPVISYTTPNTFKLGVAITALSPNSTGGPVTGGYTIAPALPTGLSIDASSGVISGTPTVTSTANDYTVTATNAGGSGTFIVRISVVVAAPVITYTTPNAFVVGTAITTLNPSNTGSPVTGGYSVSPALPSGLLLNTSTGAITGTPTTATTAANYTVTAVNAGGNGTFAINITVNPAKPNISYTTPNTFVVGTAISALSPTNNGGAAASYSISPALPTGLSIDGTSGVISGTPSVVSTAKNYTVTATNVTGSGTFIVNITVNPALPSITYPTPDTYVYGTTITALSPTSTGGAVASYSVSPTLPAGLALNTSSGAITGKPTAATAANNYTVTATNITGTGTFVINITVSPRPLNVTATGGNKTYDGTTTASVNLNDDRLSGDKLTLTSTANFLDKNVGPGKTINVTNIAISGGADAANYTLANTTTTSTANISQRALTITANGANKYFGTTLSTATGSTDFSSSGLQNGETIGSVTLTYGAGSAATDPVGTYTGSIVPSLPIAAPSSAFLVSNYNITYTAGTLTVLPPLLPAPVITYSTPNTFVYGTAITSLTPTNTGGAAASYSIDKTLPSGLSFDTGTGAISGTPTTTSAAADYIVTAHNTTGDGSFTLNIAVDKASLTITAGNQSKVYGTEQTLNTAAFTTSTLYNSDNVSGLTLTSSGSPASATVGTYDIVPSAATGTGLSNYSISYVNGKDTVKAASLTITAKNQSKTYGATQTLGTAEFTTSTLYNSDNVSGVTLTSSGSPASATVGTYDIVPSAATGSGLSNYSISYVNGKDTVKAASLTITAKNQSKTYGATQTLGTTEFTTSTLYNSDNVSGVTLTSSGSPASATVGTYDIVPSAATGSGLSNYSISYVNGKDTVKAAPLTITAKNQSKTYGATQTLGTIAFTTSTLYNSDSVTGVTLTSSGSPATATVGTYDIVPSAATGSGLSNYSISYVNGKDTVKAAPLTITAKNQCKTYGATQTLGTIAFTTSTLYNSDSVTGVTLTSSGSPATATVGTYDIVPSAATGSGLSNYSISYVNGKDTVKVAPLTITAKNQSKIYGGAQTLGSIAFTTSTLYNSDSVTGVTLTSSGSPATAVVGIYDIVPSAATGSGLSNYTISYVNGKDTVKVAPLTITAKDQTKVYGTVFTFAGTEFTPSTLYNSDQVTSVTLTSTGAPSSAPVTATPYSIVPSAAQGTGLSNYNITYKNGSLTVTPYSDCTAYAYNGTTFANADVGLTSTTVNLSLVLTTSGGADASTATVKFYNITSGTPVLIGTASVTANGLNQATYSYPYKIDIGNNLSLTNNISWVVTGNFSNSTCQETSTYVTVSSRTSDFLTGGGYVTLNPSTGAAKSAGTYKGDPGTKTNFGFNVKWNKTLTNIQGGGFNAIVRSGVLVYQIKAAKVTTLSVTPAAGTSPATAAFTSGNATVTVTNTVTGVVTSPVGNANLTVEMTDVCEPGGGNNVSSDLIAITLKDAKGVLLYSNNWDGSKTVKQPLNGGNLQIHNDANTPAPTCSSALNTVASLKNDMPTSTKPIISNDLIKDPALNPLSVTVYPNPSPNYFNLSMKGGSNEKVDVFVSDVLGHLLKTYRVTPGSSITLGDNFGVGIYIVQVRQGDTYKYYRIYKAPN
ncbi:MAG TPA: MBG domain-containing protein [Mucilaginibacter sp.]|nr:MBG domain-containing protein [Mucilaginibacter sp.]